MTKQVRATVLITLHHDHTNNAALRRLVAEYVEAAVSSWQGGLRPAREYGELDGGDFMFANIADVKVSVEVVKK